MPVAQQAKASWLGFLVCLCSIYQSGGAVLSREGWDGHAGLQTLRVGLSKIVRLALALPDLAQLDARGCGELTHLDLHCPVLLHTFFQSCRCEAPFESQTPKRNVIILALQCLHIMQHPSLAFPRSEELVCCVFPSLTCSEVLRQAQ